MRLGFAVTVNKGIDPRHLSDPRDKMEQVDIFFKRAC
jgi:hypothetical protein